MDKKLRVHGLEGMKRKYHKKLSIEAIHSVLKTRYCLGVNKARGLKNTASHALYSILCLAMNREGLKALENQTKTVSPTYFNT